MTNNSNRNTLILGIVLTLVFTAPAYTYSCKHMPDPLPPFPHEVYEPYPVVFEGEVLSEELVPPPTDKDTLIRGYVSSISKVRVVKAYKGISTGDVIYLKMIHSALTLNSPVRLQVARRYFLGVTKESARIYSTSLCGLHRLLEE